MALIWIGVAFLYAGAWVWWLNPGALGPVFVAAGAAVLALSIRMAARRSGGWRTPLAIIGIKTALTVVDAARLMLCLGALGVPAGFGQASALTVSGVLGSAVSIVPAGLGIREAVAAALAPVVALGAAAAFVAATLNRLLGLILLTPLALWLGWRARRAGA